MSYTIAQLKAKVNESLGSVFTKEDVLKMLDSISSTSNTDGMPDVGEILEKLVDLHNKIERSVSDLEVDTDSVEFSVDDRTISVESADINYKDELERCVSELDDYISDLSEKYDEVTSESLDKSNA